MSPSAKTTDPMPSSPKFHGHPAHLAQTLYITFVTDDGEVHLCDFTHVRLYWNSGKNFAVVAGRTYTMQGPYTVYPHVQPALETYNQLCLGAAAGRRGQDPT